MVQSTLFWVIAFCCNLKTHTSRKLNPEGKSAVIRGLIFWYFPYVATIYIKINCHRWFHKEFRRPFKQTHPSNTEEKHSARNQLNSNLIEVIVHRGQKSILKPHNTIVFTSITANNILSYMKTHPCSLTTPLTCEIPITVSILGYTLSVPVLFLHFYSGNGAVFTCHRSRLVFYPWNDCHTYPLPNPYMSYSVFIQTPPKYLLILYQMSNKPLL